MHWLDKLFKKGILKKDVLLMKQVDNFFDWYKNNYASIDDDVDETIQKLKYFIDKMAVWYELRYPDVNIDKWIYGDTKSVDQTMILENRYLKEQFDVDSDVFYMDWDKLYNAHVFIRSLSDDEKDFLKKPKYSETVLLSNYCRVFLNSNGTVKAIKGSFLNQVNISTVSFIGQDALSLYHYLSKNCGSEYAEPLGRVIDAYTRDVLKKHKILISVLYTIMERGGYDYGIARGLLFAKEFGIPIDFVMEYFPSSSQKELINFYLKNGGDVDLICLSNYFLVGSSEEIKYMSLREIMQENWNLSYTIEELDLIQRLVTILNRKRFMDADGQSLSIETVSKEQSIDEKRLARRLARSKRNRKD